MERSLSESRSEFTLISFAKGKLMLWTDEKYSPRFMHRWSNIEHEYTVHMFVHVSPRNTKDTAGLNPVCCC